MIAALSANSMSPMSTFADFGLGPQPSQVVQASIGSCVQVDAVRGGPKRVFQEHGEEDAKQGWCEHAAQLDAIFMSKVAEE